MSTSENLRTLEAELRGVVLHRDEEIHSAVLALVAQLHHFTVGTPGTAKSFLVDQLLARIGGLEEHEVFKILLTPFTTDVEVFGGYDLISLKEGNPRRVSRGMLATATYAWFDEIYKGNSSILNALLMAMNERQYRDGNHLIQVPLKTLFGASNEIPTEALLKAQWDRFHFRLVSSPLSSPSLERQLLDLEVDGDPRPIVSESELDEARARLSEVIIPPSIKDALVELRQSLRENGVEVTDRRFLQSLKVIQAEAYWNDRGAAQIADLRPLKHVWWSELDDRPTVLRVIRDLADPLEGEAQKIFSEIDEAYSLYKADIAQASNRSAIIASSRMLWKKVQLSWSMQKKLAAQLETEGRTSFEVSNLSDHLYTITSDISTHLGLDTDKLMGV